MNNFKNSVMNCQFVRVFRRELVRMVSRRLYFGVCVVLPLFCIFFMSTIFGNGQMENIPVGVVDEANTSMSREVVRTVEAVPTFKVTHRYVDETAARRAIQSKEIYGYLVIPTGFTADAIAGRQATLAYYYHYALLSVGGEVRGALEAVLRQLSMAPVVMQATALGIGEERVATCSPSRRAVILCSIPIWTIRSTRAILSSLSFQSYLVTTVYVVVGRGQVRDRGGVALNSRRQYHDGGSGKAVALYRYL